MNTEIKKIKGSWEEVVDDCRATVGNPDACGGKLISWAKAIGIEVGDEGIKGPPGALGVDPRGERGR